MKAMVLTGLNRIEIIEKPQPQLVNANDVLIRMKSVGICGSDIHYYNEGKIGSQVVQYPFTIGHEGAGIIEKTGAGVKNLKSGDRVAVDPAMPCFECDQCKKGRFNTCRNLKFLGCPGQAEGCLSEYLVMPETSCFKINESLTLDQAALSEPLAIGVYAVGISAPGDNIAVGILGSGPIGLSVLTALRATAHARVYMTDKIDARLKVAKDMGAGWTGNPDKVNVIEEIIHHEPLSLDAVYECCGKQEAIDQAIELLKPGGKLLIVGIPSFNRWNFDVDALRRKEITIQNVRRQNESVEKTLELISSGKAIPEKMQTHTFSFMQIKEAFELVASYRDGVVKAMIHI